MGTSGKGLSSGVQTNLKDDASALTGLATQQQGQSTSLFNSAFPGFQSAESFYGALSSGDPSAIARAIAPATQQIGQATAGAKQNILANAPSGGEKNLALEQANVAQGAQVGQTASSGYLNSFNALAKLAGQGVGESNSAANSAISGFGSSANVNQNLGQLQIQQKGANLGAYGGLAGDATQIATAGKGGQASSSSKGAAGGGGSTNIGSLLQGLGGGASGGLDTTLPSLSALLS